MMLRYTFNLDKEADAVENAVREVLRDGYRTVDIMPVDGSDKLKLCSCTDMGDTITSYIK